MSDDVGRAKYQQIINDVRADLDNISRLYGVLDGKLQTTSIVNGKITDILVSYWVDDVFVERVQSFDLKFGKIFHDIAKVTHGSSQIIKAIESSSHEVAFAGSQSNFESYRGLLKGYITDLVRLVNADLINLRAKLMKNGWQLDNIKPIEYVTQERKRYVNAREELNKARLNAEKSPEDVMNHVRTAIDLSVKERFGFKEIPKMIRFIEQADKLNFPLPSYDLIYSYFNEGNERLHEGRIHTPFEANQVIRTVSEFVDSLELIQVSPEQINEFVSKCGCVKV